MNPLFNNILITPVAPSQKVGGIVVPSRGNGDTSLGEVLAIGDQVERVSVGVKVYYAKSDTKTVEVDGRELLIVKEENLLGTLKEA